MAKCYEQKISLNVIFLRRIFVVKYYEVKSTPCQMRNKVIAILLKITMLILIWQQQFKPIRFSSR